MQHIATMTRRHRLFGLTLLASTLLLSGGATSAHAWGSDDKVLLTDVQTLTLYKGKMTAGRRSPPVQQLMCVGGDACDYFEPPVMQCKNMGHDGREVQWRCESEMEDYYRLGTTTVTCEGYRNRDDKYILRGSCGVEYTLHLTEKGRDAIARRHHGGNNHHYDPYQRVPNQKRRKAHAAYDHDDNASTWFYVLVGMGVVWFLATRCTSSSNSSPGGSGPSRPGPMPGGFGSGGGDGGNPPPPPPYSPQDQPPSNPQPPPKQSESSSSTTGTSPGGGFWTGAALGTAAGFAAGRATASSSSSSSAPLYPSVDHDSSSTSGGGWFSSGSHARSSRRRERTPSPPLWGGRTTSSSSSSGRRSPSPPRTYTSTGFGGTSNR